MSRCRGGHSPIELSGGKSLINERRIETSSQDDPLLPPPVDTVPQKKTDLSFTGDYSSHPSTRQTV